MTRVKHLLSSEGLPEPPVPIPRQSLRSLYSHSTCACPACLPHTGSRGALGTEPTTETTTFLLSPLQLLNKVFSTLQPSINFSWKKKNRWCHSFLTFTGVISQPVFPWNLYLWMYTQIFVSTNISRMGKEHQSCIACLKAERQRFRDPGFQIKDLFPPSMTVEKFL